MSKPFIVWENEEKKTTPVKETQQYDRQDTCKAFMCQGKYPIKVMCENSKPVFIFVIEEVKEVSQILITSPEKLSSTWPDILKADNFWREMYSLMKSMKLNAS